MVMVGHLDRDQMLTRRQSLERAFESFLVLAIDKGMYMVAFGALL